MTSSLHAAPVVRPPAPPRNALVGFFTHWTRFSGCASRREFWVPALTMFAVCVLYGLLQTAVQDSATARHVTDVVAVIVKVSLVVPSLALCSRRLHDSGCGATWLWVLLLPGIGVLLLLGLMLRHSRPELVKDEWLDPGAPTDRDPLTSLRSYLTLLAAGTLVATFIAGLNSLSVDRLDDGWRYMVTAGVSGVALLGFAGGLFALSAARR